jgi:uncharacterized protein (TIGR02099 family)
MELGEHGQDSHASFGLEEIEASFRWFDRTEGWQLDVAGLRLRGDAGRWPESELSVRTDYTGPHAWRVSAGASFLRVQDLVGIFEVVPLAGQGLEATLPALRPAADLSDLQLRYERNVDKPATWAARGSVNGFSSRALDDIPAIEGVSGRFWGNEAHGGLDLETEGLKLIFASLFRDPLQADVARGRIQWHRNTGGGWELGGHRIAVANSDVKTWSRFSLQVPEKPEEGIFLDLQMDFRDANAAAVPRYLPVAIMDEELISWLDEAFVSGRVPSGSGLVRGNLEKFPFAGSEGRFEVLFGTEDVILDYWPKWPRLQEIDADVAFLNNRFDVQVERAQMAGSEVVGARGQIDRLSEGSPFHLTGRIKGDVADGLWLLRETPLSEDMSLPDDLAGKGTLSVDLSMKIPLSDEGKLAVGARMDWKNVSLNLPDLGLEASQINGEVSLDEKLVLNSRNLTAQVFGIPLQISLSTPGVAGKPRFDRLEAEGFVPIELLRKQFPGADLRWLDGAAQGRVQLDVPWDFEDEVPRMDLRLISNLRGISVDLPAPLGKPADDVSPLNLDAVITRDGRVSKLKAKYGEVVSAEFLPSIVDNAFSLAAGVIGLGPDPVDAAGVKGLKVTGTWPELEIEPWVDWYSALPASSLEGSDAAELFPALNQVDAGFGAVDAFGEVFRDVRMELNRSDSGDWPGRFSSDRLAGAISIPRDLAEGTLVASLDYLKLDFEVSDVNTEVATQQVSGFGGGVDPVAPAESRVDPRELPQLQVDGKQLLVNGTDLGVFRVVTARKPWGQELGELSVDSSHLEVNGKGGWRVESQGQQTELSLSLKSPGLGKLLKKLGVSSNLKGAPAEFKLDYRWPAGPTDFSVATVEGTLYMKLGEGRMPKVDPGLGRALGLFNIMTLQRRLSLDFSDIFKEGFAFDKIEGHFRQADGSLFTDDFFMEGPAARIEVRGRTGLLAEDFDQVITVTPRVSSTGVIAGAIAAGPVVGAALLVANQLAGDRVDKLASSRYSLKGSWQNPAIEKLKGKTQPAANTPNDYDSIATE